uniref:Uncharacterized protein n=1 Tax=Chrysotila carterae TaxID=13221 RepID=A0A7S4BLR5_CHRCT
MRCASRLLVVEADASLLGKIEMAWASATKSSVVTFILRANFAFGTSLLSCGAGVVCIGGIGAAGAASGEAALLMPLSAGALHLAWQTRTLDLNSRESCLRLFRSNRDFGAIVFAAIVACKLISLASDGGDGGGSSSGAGSLHSGSSEGGSGGSGSADGGDDGGSSSSSHIGSGRGRGDMNEKRAHSSAEHVDTEDTC